MKRPRTSFINAKNIAQKRQSQQFNEFSENLDEEGEENYYGSDSKEKNDLSSFIYSLINCKFNKQLLFIK